MSIRRLDGLVFAVHDPEHAASAWAEAFGLKAEPPYRPEGPRPEPARLPVGDAFLELAGPTTGQDRLARHLAERGEEMFSLSLETDDLDGAVQGLRAKGITVSEPEAGGWPNTRLARIDRDSAHGVEVQLIERRRP